MTPIDVNRHSSKPLHILVVEDSSSARMSIVSSLNTIDAVIHEADDGLPALALLKQKKPEIDLVLTDLIMKTMHGDELCHRIRNEIGRKDLPVIILSSQTDKDTIIRLFKAGASDYLFKPFMAEELVARITAHLEQRILNKILEQNVVELRELNRMKDHFLAACSHDFRSPLQGILGFTELMICDSSLTDHHHSLLKNIMRSGNQLNDLIESLLDFSIAGKRPEDITLVPLNVADIVESSASILSCAADTKKISITVSPFENIPLIKGNPSALSRVFNNLLSNAVKFTSPGGRISIDCEYQDGNDCISIIVKDNGMGIPEDDISRIFERYSKASRNGTQGEKSTGLGLYITHKIVELHHGTISVTSRPNKGTCFTVTLPVEA